MAGEGREGKEERRSEGWLGLLELCLRVGPKVVVKTNIKMMMIRVIEEGMTSMNLMFSEFFCSIYEYVFQTNAAL